MYYYYYILLAAITHTTEQVDQIKHPAYYQSESSGFTIPIDLHFKNITVT
jgi:hypothetical protein